MNEDLESQRDEDEALMAIYDGDPAFNRMSETVFQYLCGERGTPNSILLEFQWPPTYPTDKPIINMDTFYNQNLSAFTKNFFLEKIDEKVVQYLGVAMTYTLIELVKDHIDNWFIEVSKLEPKEIITKAETTVEDDISKLQVTDQQSKKEPKKENLSKAQKRRMWNKCDAHGDKPRGYDWVDIVKHLSQTGAGKSEAISTAS